MSFTLEQLYNLIPAIYRIRDLENSGEVGALLGDSMQSSPSSTGDTAQSLALSLPLKSLMTILQEQIAVLDENLEQLYDDQFIETCAEWVIPYIGDIVGFQLAHDIGMRNLREEVAYTISFRRRKGTTELVEQLARDVTGWGAHVIEYFQSLAMTQNVNRYQPQNRLVNISHDNLTLLNTPFETQVHTADVRHITSEHGAYSPANTGIFLWRLFAYSLTNVPATKLDDYRYLFNPLGCHTQLFSRASKTALVEKLDGPQQSITMPLTRYLLTTHLNGYYGPDKSLLLFKDGKPVMPTMQLKHGKLVAQQKLSDLLVIRDLGDLVDDDENFVDWNNMPQGKIAIDPVRGRIAFPRDQPAPQTVHSTYHYGFSADIGGGEYRRVDSFTTLAPVITVSTQGTQTIQAALDALLQQGDGVVEIADSGRYEEELSLHVDVNQRIELRAADVHRPLLKLMHEAEGTSGEDNETDEKEDDADEEDGENVDVPSFVIEGEDGSQVTINGLIISGGSLRIRGSIAQVTLKHCTFVPGLSLLEDGTPQYPGEASIIVEAENVSLLIDACIVGALQVTQGANVRIVNSIIDANDETSLAYAGVETESSEDNDEDEVALGGTLSVETSTIIGMVRTRLLSLASNSIFLATSPDEEDGQGWEMEPVYVQRIQDGGMRYSYVPLEARVPRRYKCQPTQGTADFDRVHLTSFHYGDAGYGQLSKRCPEQVTQGADDGAEMGAFHLLFQPQREATLNSRLTEYMRFDMMPEIYFMT